MILPPARLPPPVRSDVAGGDGSNPDRDAHRAVIIVPRRRRPREAPAPAPSERGGAVDMLI